MISGEQSFEHADDPHGLRIQQLVRRLAAVDDPHVLERVALEVLSQRPIALLADFLSVLGQRSRHDQVRPIYMAIVRLCLAGDEPDEAVRAALYSAVSANGEGAYVRFLLPLPAKRDPVDGDAPRDQVLDEMPLGTKKWRARLQDRDLLGRLAREGDVNVMTILLDNSRVVEEDVVLWAARRPMRPDALLAVACHRRWSLRPRVQEALARNPYAPVHVAASYMPVFTNRLLRRISQDASLHELVRQAASENLALRQE
jgi:hypothetical protein